MARLSLLLLSVLVAAVTADISLDGYQTYQVTPETWEQLARLEAFAGDEAVDFWTRTRRLGVPSVVMVAPERQSVFLNALDDLQTPWTTLIHNVQDTVDAEKIRQASAPRDGRSISFTKYNRYQEIVDYLNELATNYPNVVKVSSIGSSSEGRAVPLVKISSGNSAGKPVILIDAGIHAREWIAPAMALYIIQQLVENPQNADLIAGAEWHIIPVLNPDGYEYTHTNYRMWRKTRSESQRCLLSGVSDTKNGVDANRNFGFHWMEVGASSSPCSDTYAGPQAFSEPETAALRNYVLQNADSIELYITFHSYGNYFLYPWGYTSSLPSDWQILDSLARQANAAQVAAGGSSYSIGSSTNVLYAAAGGSDDWVKGVGGVPLSYTVELPGGGLQGFDLPASAIARTVQQFFPAVRVMGEYVISE